MYCLKCSTGLDEANEKSFFKCDGCTRPLHIQCAGLSATEIRCVELKGKRKMKYFCDDCEKGLLIIPELISKIENLERKLTNLEVGGGSNNIMTDENLFQEIVDRQYRAQNIMVYNIPEDNNTSMEARITEDKNKINELFRCVESATIQKVIRVGKKGNNARPLKVVLSSRDEVLAILKKKRQILSDSNSNIRLLPDETVMQRDYFKKIKSELNDRLAKECSSE